MADDGSVRGGAARLALAAGRLGGWLAGLLLVWLLNVARIVALFFAWRADAQWFDWLHNYIGPIVLVALLALYFHGVMQRAPAAVPEPDIGYR